MAEKRKRAQNFTSHEKQRLVQLVSSHRDTLLNRKNDAVAIDAKNNAWVKITETYNATALVIRTKESLVKCWEKIKGDARSYLPSRRDSNESSDCPEKNPLLEFVCKLLRRSTGEELVDFETAFPELELAQDTGQPNMVLTSVKVEPLTLPGLPVSVDDNQDSFICEEPEAMSSFSTSYQNVKKNEKEELRIQLLREEIEFKRRLHTLQLEAAAKEVEIKTEILNQIKGGSISIGQMVGASYWNGDNGAQN